MALITVQKSSQYNRLTVKDNAIEVKSSQSAKLTYVVSVNLRLHNSILLHLLPCYEPRITPVSKLCSVHQIIPKRIRECDSGRNPYPFGRL